MADIDCVSKKSQDTSQNTDSMWDTAIKDALGELANAEQRVSRLRNALRIFKENKVKGVPWPSGATQLPD